MDGMIILIDGYNVLKQAVSPGTLSEYERKKFINQLGKYAKKKGHKIVLVFDGGPFDWASKARESGIYVVYAGANETADDYIKQYLKDNKSLDILLISSDNDIRRTAAFLGIEALDSNEFYTIMQQALGTGNAQKNIRETKAIKTTENKHEELDLLMQEASKVVQYKTEDFIEGAESRKSKAHKSSKKNRRRLKKIKKL